MRSSLRMRAAARPAIASTRWTHLPGGSGGVWRVDDPVLGPTVHRPTGPWTPAVHDLLASPRRMPASTASRACLGFDDEGREVLTVPCPGARSRSTPRAARTRCSPRRPRLAAPLPRRRARRTTRVRASGARRAASLERRAADLPQRHRRVQLDRRRRPVRRHDRLGSGRARACRSTTSRSSAGAASRSSDDVPATDAARRVAHRRRGVRRRRRPRTLLDAIADRMRRASDRIAAGIGAAIPGMLSLRALGEPERTAARASTRVPRPRLPGDSAPRSD